MQQASPRLFYIALWSECLHLVRPKFWQPLEALVYVAAACLWVGGRVDSGTDVGLI